MSERELLKYYLLKTYQYCVESNNLMISSSKNGFVSGSSSLVYLSHLLAFFTLFQDFEEHPSFKSMMISGE